MNEQIVHPTEFHILKNDYVFKANSVPFIFLSLGVLRFYGCLSMLCVLFAFFSLYIVGAENMYCMNE